MYKGIDAVILKKIDQEILSSQDRFDVFVLNDNSTIKQSIENKNCHFLLLSTSFVYSNSEKNYEDSVTKPLTLYGKFRLEQESLLTKSNFPYTILRIANIYGHQNFCVSKFNNVIDKFISNIFSNQEISLYGDGTQLVDFVHIDNFLKILNQIIDDKSKNEIYNISNEFRMSISDIVNDMKNIAETKYNISVQLNKRDDDPLPNIPNTSTSKIQKKFLWKNSQNMNLKLESMFENIKNS